MSGTGGDETYLEAFVEYLSALPHDVKRGLELLKDLDGRCSDGTAELLHLQQQYLEEAEARMMELEIVVQQQQQQQTTESDGDVMEIDQPTESSNPATSNYTEGLRVLGNGSRAVVIPTTLELEQYVHGVVDPPTDEDGPHNDRRLRGSNSGTRYGDILDRQRDLLQLADEKVAVASQLYDRMDGTVRRLDRDLAEMEKLLQVRKCTSNDS